MTIAGLISHPLLRKIVSRSSSSLSYWSHMCCTERYLFLSICGKKTFNSRCWMTKSQAMCLPLKQYLEQPKGHMTFGRKSFSFFRAFTNRPGWQISKSLRKLVRTDCDHQIVIFEISRRIVVGGDETILCRGWLMKHPRPMDMYQQMPGRICMPNARDVCL